MELTNQDYNGADFGIVPEDWEFVQLNDCLDLLTDYEANGSFESIANNVNIYDTENFAWFVRATDLENRTKGKDIKYVDKETYQFLRKTKLFGDEVLITKRGEIGKVYYFKMRTEFATLAPNLYLLKLNKRVLPFYLYCFFISPIGVRLLVEKNASSTLGALYKDDIKSISFPLPTKSEQTAIATALSDADALIENLEELIAKKRNIKHGVMQELLTGEKRLAGFNGKWGTIRIGEVADIFKGNGLSKIKLNPEGKYKCILYGELFTTYKHIIEDVVSHTDFNEGLYSKVGDILIPGSTTTIGIDLAIASTVLEDNILLGGDINVIRPKKASINSIFLAYYIAETMKHKISELTQGITIIHLYGKDLKTLEIKIPEISEQDAIAKILVDIDEEISGLEKHMNKYKLIKQGMMQALLTGKIRLV